MDRDEELEAQLQLIQQSAKAKKQPKIQKSGRIFDSANHELEKKKKVGTECSEGDEKKP